MHDNTDFYRQDISIALAYKWNSIFLLMFKKL